jgi:hypothetical protein
MNVTKSTYDNTGLLFVNDKKESDKHTDHTGSLAVDEREYPVSGGLKKDRG